MKRIITLVSLAVLAVPAFAAERGAPFEQTLLDRSFPAVTSSQDRAASGSSSAAPTESVWAKDYNFLAPPR